MCRYTYYLYKLIQKTCFTMHVYRYIYMYSILNNVNIIKKLTSIDLNPINWFVQKPHQAAFSNNHWPSASTIRVLQVSAWDGATLRDPKGSHENLSVISSPKASKPRNLWEFCHSLGNTEYCLLHCWMHITKLWFGKTMDNCCSLSFFQNIGNPRENEFQGGYAFLQPGRFTWWFGSSGYAKQGI